MNTRPQSPQSSPPDDLELLSAYLDNELTAAERVNLERRLSADPRLRGELDDLRAVSAALQSLDPLPLPRSFTLDPARVRRPGPIFPLAWLMQMGSGLAGLALVLLATVQMLGAGAVPMAPAAREAAPTEAPAAASAPMASAEYAQATAAPAATSAPLATQDPAAMSAPAAAPTAAPAAGAAESAPAADQAMGTASSDPGDAGPAGGVADGPASNSPAPPQAQSGPPPGGAGGDPSIDATVDAMRQSPAAGGAAQEQPDPMAAKGAASPIGPGVTLALGLALLTLALGWNLAGRRRV